MIRRLLLVLLTLAAALPFAAAAETYQVDFLVFAQGGIDGEAPQPPQTVDVGHAIEPTDITRLHNAGIQIVTDSAGRLASLWNGLSKGRHYEPIAHLSWIQVNPSEMRGPALHVTAGGTIDTPTGPVRALNGTVALHGGFYLHVDTNLVWTTKDADGKPVSWRLDENRRLRLNETHFLDGARLGVVTRVTKLAR